MSNTLPPRAGSSAPDAVVAKDAGGDGAATLDVKAPTRNPACDPFDDGTYGSKHPWTGFQHGSDAFTCNTCRGGYENLQGIWRFIDFKTEDPATSLGDYRETLEFDGNLWIEHMAGDDEGKQVDATAKGWFWCGDHAELPSKHEVFILDTVEPDGAFGNQSNTVFSASVKTSMENSDVIAIGFFSGFESGKSNEYLYCRVGSTVKGHPCGDPFVK